MGIVFSGIVRYVLKIRSSKRAVGLGFMGPIAFTGVSDESQLPSQSVLAAIQG